MRFLKTLTLALGLAAPVSAQTTTYFRTFISTTTGLSTTTAAGYLNIAASSITAGTPTIIFNGQLGAITLGAWQGTVVGAKYGGTAADLSAATQGSVPQFHATGVMTALAPGVSGQLLKSQGAAADVAWVNQSAIVAGSATNIAGGSANQVVIQTGAGATGFVGPLTNGQLLIGSTGNPPVATALSCTANEVSCTPGAGTLTVGGGGQQTACTSGQALLAATYNHGVATGGTCTGVAMSGVNSQPEPAWNGFNYLQTSSSGSAIMFSTTTSVSGGGAFWVANATWVYQGALYNTQQTRFEFPVASTSTVITFDAVNGLKQWSLRDLMPPSISSHTQNDWQDFLIVGIATADAKMVISFFDTVNRLPTPYLAYSNGISSLFAAPPTLAQPYTYYNCRLIGSGTHDLESCDTNTLGMVAFDGRTWKLPWSSLTTTQLEKWSFVIKNTTAGSVNLVFGEGSSNNTSSWISVDGAAGVNPTASGSNPSGSTTVSITNSPAYHLIEYYVDPQAGGNYSPWIQLPAGLVYVRPGPG